MKKRIAFIVMIITCVFSVINLNTTEVHADFNDVVLDDFDTD